MVAMTCKCGNAAWTVAQDDEGGKQLICGGSSGCRNAIKVFVLLDPKADNAWDWGERKES
jgi:hypothetical protein